VVKPGIDRDILAGTSSVLKQKGYNRIDVQVSGREVVLNGAVSGASAESSALEVSESVYGVRSVTSNLEFKPLRLPHLKVSRSLDNYLKLEGEVPTQYLADRFVELAKSTVSHQRFIDLLRVDPEVTDPKWVDTVKAIMVEGNYLSGMEIEIGAGHLSLGGLMADASGYGVLIQRIQQFSRNQNLSFNNRIGITPTTEYSPVKESDIGETEIFTIESEILDENEPMESASDSPVKLKSDQNQPNSELSSKKPPVSLQKVSVEETATRLETDQIDEAGIEIRKHDEANAVDQQIGLNDTEVEGVKVIQDLENCQTRLNDMLLSNPLTFSSNSAVLSVDNHTVLAYLNKILSDCPTYNVFIGGHTDARGDSISNRRLSNQRAEAVMQTMIKLGVDSSRISAEGFGATRPIASNETTAGRQRNRRIEFILTPK
jgi:outer membrane protein OmpA-like peptidoglycan-associated protein